jgi:hypothetical protein
MNNHNLSFDKERKKKREGEEKRLKERGGGNVFGSNVSNP